ncbi:MAG: hypothetical protein OEN21_10890 [Myxococcales bacterium]|nr:hypothetical protein [Myxococcales bacterium]
MTRIFLTIAMAAAVAMGCDSTDTLGGGGNGGAGGMGGGGIGPLTWVGSEITIVGTDECMFFNESEALTFEMTIDGTTLTLMDTDTSLTVSTDNYFDTADEVTLTGSTENANFDPCVVMLDDAMQLGLDNTEVSIDQNTTLSVTWDHVEEELSTDECLGVWFNDLPCAGEVTMTLTQSPAP